MQDQRAHETVEHPPWCRIDLDSRGEPEEPIIPETAAAPRALGDVDPCDVEPYDVEHRGEPAILILHGDDAVLSMTGHRYYEVARDGTSDVGEPRVILSVLNTYNRDAQDVELSMSDLRALIGTASQLLDEMTGAPDAA